MFVVRIEVDDDTFAERAVRAGIADVLAQVGDMVLEEHREAGSVVSDSGQVEATFELTV
jgi:hypothetical protein